jgi:hypothetical protein
LLSLRERTKSKQSIDSTGCRATRASGVTRQCEPLRPG